MTFERTASRSVLAICFILLATLSAVPAAAQSAAPPPSYGPYSVRSLAGGIGVTQKMSAHDPLAFSG